jgi:hypothetical protein
MISKREPSREIFLFSTLRNCLHKRDGFHAEEKTLLSTYFFARKILLIFLFDFIYDPIQSGASAKSKRRFSVSDADRLMTLCLL